MLELLRHADSISLALAGGMAPACWQREVAHACARLRTIRQVSDWSIAFANINIQLRDDPLLGNYLSELVARAQRPSQADREYMRPPRSSTDARSDSFTQDKRGASRSVSGKPRSIAGHPAQVSADAAKPDATEPSGNKHERRRWPARWPGWPSRRSHHDNPAKVERVERRPSLPTRINERQAATESFLNEPRRRVPLSGAGESPYFNPSETSSISDDGGDATDGVQIPALTETRTRPEHTQQGAGDDRQNAPTFSTHINGGQDLQALPSEVAGLPQQAPQSLLLRLTSAPVTLPSALNSSSEMQSQNSLALSGDEQQRGGPSALEAKRNRGREVSQAKKILGRGVLSSVTEGATKRSAHEADSSFGPTRTKDRRPRNVFFNTGSSSAIPAFSARAAKIVQSQDGKSGVLKSSNGGGSSGWPHEKEVRHVWQGEITRRIARAIRRAGIAVKVGIAKLETEFETTEFKAIGFKADGFDAAGSEAAESLINQQWSLSLFGPTAPANLLASFAGFVQLDHDTRQDERTRASVSRSLAASEKTGTPEEASHASHRASRNHEQPLAPNEHRQTVMPYAEEGVRQMADGDWTDFSLPQRIAPPAVSPSLPALIPPQVVDMPILPVASETARQDARIEALASDDDMEALADKIKFILDEQARRHGIDV